MCFAKRAVGTTPSKIASDEQGRRPRSSISAKLHAILSKPPHESLPLGGLFQALKLLRELLGRQLEQVWLKNASHGVDQAEVKGRKLCRMGRQAVGRTGVGEFLLGDVIEIRLRVGGTGVRWEGDGWS